MPDIAGVAAEILLGDTKPKVIEARAEADPRTIQIIQQCIAIAGWRQSAQQRQGGWREQDVDQLKFEGFDLRSYSAGLLDFRIGPRPFIPEPPMEERKKWELLTLKSEGMGIPKAYLVQNEGGYSKTQLAEMERLREEEAAKQPPPPPVPVQGRVVGKEEPLVPVDKGETIGQIITPGGK
jgi:hypothetical protein